MQEMPCCDETGGQVTTELPEPLTPTDCDLSDFQYMELDVRRLRDSKFAASVDGEAFRAGVLLWCAAWHQIPAASLPDDDIELANLAGYGRVIKEWRKVRAEALAGFVKCSDGRLYHSVIAEKAVSAHQAKLRHAHGKMSERVRKENAKRAKENMPVLGIPTFEQWNSGAYTDGIKPENQAIPTESKTTSAGIPAENPLRGNGEGTEREREQNGEGDFKAVGAELEIAPPSASPEAKAADESRGSRLPKEWHLPKAWGEWALAEHPTWTPDHVRRVAEKFRDHWIGKAGKDGRKSDWLATWRNWVRNESALTHRVRPPAQDQDEVNRRAKEMLFGEKQEIIDV